MLHREGQRGTTEICNENMPYPEKSRSEEVFRRFVEDTVQGMINLENNRRGDLSSSLSVFCRVDVAVCQPGGLGPFSYYVNEVERSLTVGLFRRATPVHFWGMIHGAVGEMTEFIRRSRAYKGRG
jgi:hypothetical protein